MHSSTDLSPSPPAAPFSSPLAQRSDRTTSVRPFTFRRLVSRTNALDSSRTAGFVMGDGLSADELRLGRLVNRYRSNHDLPRIPLSKALTTVGNRHVRDLDKYGVQGSLHAWSDAPYDANDPDTYPSMWEAPQRLKTGYPGYGYENAYGASGFTVTPKGAFQAWKNSPPHNAVMLSEGIWSDSPWKALGVGMYKGFAVLWFGHEKDPTGKPPEE